MALSENRIPIGRRDSSHSLLILFGGWRTDKIRFRPPRVSLQGDRFRPNHHIAKKERLIRSSPLRGYQSSLNDKRRINLKPCSPEYQQV
jgi:hypothetical protein